MAARPAETGFGSVPQAGSGDRLCRSRHSNASWRAKAAHARSAPTASSRGSAHRGWTASASATSKVQPPKVMVFYDSNSPDLLRSDGSALSGDAAAVSGTGAGISRPATTARMALAGRAIAGIIVWSRSGGRSSGNWLQRQIRQGSEGGAAGRPGCWRQPGSPEPAGAANWPQSVTSRRIDIQRKIRRSDWKPAAASTPVCNRSACAPLPLATTWLTLQQSSSPIADPVAITSWGVRAGRLLDRAAKMRPSAGCSIPFRFLQAALRLP